MGQRFGYCSWCRELLTETSLLLANRFLHFFTLHAAFVARALAVEGLRCTAGWCVTTTRDSAQFCTRRLELVAALCPVPGTRQHLPPGIAARREMQPLPSAPAPCTRNVSVSAL